MPDLWGASRELNPVLWSHSPACRSTTLHATRWYLYLCTRQGSNLRPDPLQGNALPAELLMHLTDQAGFEPTNLLVNSEVHYQFCYWPMMYGLSRIWTCDIWFRRPAPCPLGYKSINLPSRDRTDLNHVYSVAFIHWIIGRQGGLGENRTPDSRIKSPVLYHLVTNPISQ